MKPLYKKLHEIDNVAVAMHQLTAKDFPGLLEEIPAKHKFALCSISQGEPIIMYGVKVGVALQDIKEGTLISVGNTGDPEHEETSDHPMHYQSPPVNTAPWDHCTFQGIVRPDGKVGTANYWIFVPLVFCENQTLRTIEKTLQEALGYQRPNPYLSYAHELLGKNYNVHRGGPQSFRHIDGIRFLYHQGGCGGTRDDSETLMRLLAGYVHHPNVAGATILSLGCQNAQLERFRAIEEEMFPGASKPRVYLEHQQIGNEDTFIRCALRETIHEMTHLPVARRVPVPLKKLILGLECGGSDGFSGITANPLAGEISDLISALGGSSILAEFPELAGMEEEIIRRCRNRGIADKFSRLFSAYAARAEAVGARFEQNPSPGNIREGLITLAMKSAGAVRKGGNGIITDVLDYTEPVRTPGLNLLCTPGNDVESTTALVSSGANIILFTTGLGTPTGNPIVPVIKISSNSSLSASMQDIIDFDAGRLIENDISQERLVEQLMELVIDVAGGEKTCSMKLDQNDFIPWKRGISL